MSRHHRYLYAIWSRLTRDVEISDRICENLMAVEVKSHNVSSLDLEYLSHIPIVVKIFPSDYRRSCSGRQSWQGSSSKGREFEKRIAIL